MPIIRELIRTSVRMDNRPLHRDIVNLQRLNNEILSPLELIACSYFVTSGFRSVEVNKAVGGHPKSAHMEGRAADIVPLGKKLTIVGMMRVIILSALKFDKVIFEAPNDTAWIHIQIARANALPRKVVFMCLEPNVFVPWDDSSEKIKDYE